MCLIFSAEVVHTATKALASSLPEKERVAVMKRTGLDDAPITSDPRQPAVGGVNMSIQITPVGNKQTKNKLKTEVTEFGNEAIKGKFI